MTEIEFLQRALASDKQSGKSPMVAEYELALAAHFRTDFALSVNSGSAAIQTALAALGAGPGRTVIVSAGAPLPTLLPIAATGAAIRFVDCRPDNVAIDPAAIPAALDDTVVAVVEVPLWGYPQDYGPLLEQLEPRGIALVEDAAQAHGAEVDGRFVGTLATIGCFSTHEKKFLSTGEGGFIVTRDEALFERTKSFARLGHLSGRSPGMNFKISAFTAAIGLARLARLDEVVARRRANHAALLRGLASTGLSEMAHIGTPNGYNLVIDIGEAASNGALASALAGVGIATDAAKYGYKCGYKQALFAGRSAPCPNAEALLGRLIQLPTDSADPAATAASFSAIMGEHTAP